MTRIGALATVVALAFGMIVHLGLQSGRIVSVPLLLRASLAGVGALTHLIRSGSPPLPDGPISSFQPRPSDVIVAVPGRSGTTWLQHICHQLRMGGAEPDFENQLLVMPWLEVFSGLGRNLDGEQVASPRVFKTHVPYAKLPKGGKKIYCFRAIEDVAVSGYKHVLPLLAISEDDLSLTDYATLAMAAGIPHGMLDNLVDFWAHRHDPDVLLLFYDDMNADPRSTVQRIARFIGIRTADDALIDKVTAQTSHEVMSRADNAARFDSSTLLGWMYEHAGRLKSEIPQVSIISQVRGNGGKTGAGKHQLSSVVLLALSRAWETKVGSVLGFKTLGEMRAAWRAESQAGSG